MRINVLFTTNDSILSKAIRRVTNEPVSHVAIELPEFNAVVHATLPKVKVDKLQTFNKNYKVIYKIEYISISSESMLRLLRHIGCAYDIIGLMNLAMIYSLLHVGVSLSSRKILQVSGAYMCTEFATEVLSGCIDSEITPYKLYLELKKEYMNDKDK